MLNQFVEILRSFWGLWAMTFFIGIVLWAYWPKNKAKLEGYGMIALRDDEN